MRPGGAPIMLLSLLERLVERHQVAMLLPGSPDPAFAERYRAAGVDLLDEASPSDFDVFLVNTLYGASSVVAADDRVPVVWWIHEPAFGLKIIEAGQADTSAFDAATRVIFPSDWQATALYGRWLERSRWSVVPTAVPPLSDVRRRRGDDGHFRLLHVGAVEHRKGQDVSIKALLALRDETFELRFVGRDDGRWAQKGKGYLGQSPSAARQVVWCGNLSPQETLQEIADADALIFPTRDDLFALVVLEAMSLGVPVICSDYGALGDELTDGEEALLVPTGDHDALANAIRRLRSEPGLSERLVRNARSRVVAKRSYDAFVQAMEAELYAAVEAFRCRAGA